MRIDHDGNVGIGTKSPAANLHIVKENSNAKLLLDTFSNASDARVVARKARGTIDAPLTMTDGEFIGSFVIEGYEGGVYDAVGQISVVADQDWSGSAHGTHMRFYTTSNGSTSISERMRIDHDGKIGIGTNAPATTLHLNHSSGFSFNGLTIQNGGSWNIYNAVANELWLVFNNSQKGEFDEVTGVYSAISDARLKKNIEPVATALDGIMQLKPSMYHFATENDNDPKHYGLIAQDLLRVFPEVVTVRDQSEDGGTMDDLHLVAHTDMIPILVRGIQEQQEVIANLEARLAKIESSMLGTNATVRGGVE